MLTLNVNEKFEYVDTENINKIFPDKIFFSNKICDFAVQHPPYVASGIDRKYYQSFHAQSVY